ncbi:coactosin-like protein isoform X1 [Bubalus kerabau]|uniref:coactosin-like protein isoform X1 n=1 Tax=Bubalus carabanensis TaxID=3119969 RepID=UPI00244EDA16|nr:coactosin-like protein isoform X1 [Bubalus carabanensis]
MATKIDKEACRTAYNLVRDDSSAVIWVTFKYDGSTIVPGEQGAEYQDFIQQCTDDVRLFAFVRFTTGDAMSKRSKFALITWIGENVSGLQRAKTGTDKTLVKEVVQPTRLLRPWDSPGKNIGVGCRFLLQRTFLTQGSNLYLLHWQVNSLPLHHQESP